MFVFFSYCDNPYEYMVQADVLALTSNYEGLPNALMEAMAVGLACVSTDCMGGGPKQLLNGIEGALVETENKYELANSIKNILINDDIRMELEEQIKKRSELFRMEEVGKQWISFLFDGYCIEY